MINSTMVYSRSQKSAIGHNAVQQVAAWIALLCYAVLLLHMVLVHTADFMTQGRVGISDSSNTLAWVANPVNASQPDCPVCHVTRSNPQVAAGSGHGVYEIPPIVDLIERSSSTKPAYTDSLYSTRAPPIG